MIRAVLALTFTPLLASATPTPSTPAPTPARSGSVAIVDVTIEVGDGTTIAHGTVVVKDGRISAVGTGAAPAGVRVVDGKGKVLTPGLIAFGSRTGIAEVDLEASTVDSHQEGLAVPAFRPIDGYNPLSPRVRADRAQGLTTAVLTPWGGLIAGQAFAVDLDGTLPSIQRGREVLMVGLFGRAAADVAGGTRSAAWMKLRELLDDARFVRANLAAYDRAAATRVLALPRVQLEALWPVIDGKVPLLVDVHRASDILALLRFAAEEKIRVVVSGGEEGWMVARELAAARVPVILQPSTIQDPGSFDSLYARLDSPQLLAAAGVSLSMVSWNMGTSRLRQEAGMAVAHGLPRDVAIRAISLEPARVLGLDAELGSVQVGKRANLVLWSGDPLEVTTSASAVFIDGSAVDLTTRADKLVERYRKQVH